MIAAIKKKEGFKGQKAVVIPRQVLAAKCSKNEVISSLYITDIGYYPKAFFHYRERIHGAEQHILIYCHEGCGTATVNKETYPIEAGDFFLIPAKTPHSYKADENNAWTIYWLHFKGLKSNQLVSLINKKMGFKSFIRHKEKSLALFNEMYDQLERGYGMDNLTYANMCLSYFLTTFLYNEKANASESTKTIDPADIAIDFLNRNISKILTLENIAAEINLSPSHFSYLFKKKTGFTPIEYFNHLKVQKACQHLLFTTSRVSEIAAELGIEDQYYFSRMFKKVMGMSPKEYREKRIH